MPVLEPVTDVETVAHELWSAVGPLLRRLIAEKSMPFGQVSVLGRLEREGPLTTSDLAARERVRPQSMAQTVGELEQAGLLTRGPDPDDRRKVRLHLSAVGVQTLARERRASQQWLVQAVGERLDEREQVELLRAAELIARLTTP